MKKAPWRQAAPKSVVPKAPPDAGGLGAASPDGTAASASAAVGGPVFIPLVQPVWTAPTNIFKFAEIRPTSGDGVDAQDERFLLRCAQEVVRAMHEDRDFVQPLYDKYLGRKEARSRQLCMPDSTSFTKTVKSLRAFEED